MIKFTAKDIDLKERTYQAMSDLETEIKAIHSLRNRLQTNVNDLLSSAMKSDNKQFAEHYMEEYDDLSNLLSIVKSAEMLLQNLSVKIDSARYLQELVATLNSAMLSLRIVRSDIRRIIPSIDITLERIGTSIMELKQEMQIREVNVHELPPMTVVHELPLTVTQKGPINLTSFTTAVHTPV
jgi:hypothetical protein